MSTQNYIKNFLKDLFWALVYICTTVVLVVVVLTALIFYYLKKSFLGTFIDFLCNFLQNGFIDTTLLTIESLSIFVPPIALLTTPVIKVLNAFTFTCTLFKNPRVALLFSPYLIGTLLPIVGPVLRFTIGFVIEPLMDSMLG